MNRAGAALPAALLTILILGALAGAALVAGRFRWLGGSRALFSSVARVAAEAAVERAVRTWDAVLAESLAIGDGARVPEVRAEGADSVLRLGRTLFLVRAISERRSADDYLLARHGAAEIVELTSPQLADVAALTVRGAADVAPEATVEGVDRVPPGWEGRCPPADSASEGIRQDSVGLFDRLGAVSAGQLLDWADLQVAGPVGRVGPVVTADARCERTNLGNWGDPAEPNAVCGGWFPIVAAGAGTRVSSGSGQGLLVAPVGLELSGTARFFGVILVGGPLILRDEAEVVGAVLADGGAVLENRSRIARSSCAVSMALSHSARPFRRVPRGLVTWP